VRRFIHIVKKIYIELHHILTLMRSRKVGSGLVSRLSCIKLTLPGDVDFTKSVHGVRHTAELRRIDACSGAGDA
jgi:hypothetical protein